MGDETPSRVAHGVEPVPGRRARSTVAPFAPGPRCPSDHADALRSVDAGLGPTGAGGPPRRRQKCGRVPWTPARPV